MLNRVVVTGFGNVCAFGREWSEIRAKFEAKQNAVKFMSEWDRFGSELNTRLAAPIINYAPPSQWDRKQLRSLGIVSQYAVEAAGLALKDAGLLDDESIKDGRMGVAAGSSTGSTGPICEAVKLMLGMPSNFNANTYVKMMPHTTAANIAIFYGLKGRMIPTSSACTSASHAIGYSYEAIKYGQIDMMLAGGAEELCPSEAFVFDRLFATSCKNDAPNLAPAPFDSERDGLVLGEGGSMLVLESLESAKKRNAKIYAEIVGFGSSCDGTHITRPQSATMKEAMRLALKDANLTPEKIGYINAHATATKQGDIAESIATNELFGEKTAISSLKSYLGHTLGACGALESFFSIMMMKQSRFYPNLNLNKVDCECANLNYLRDITEIKTEFVMNNNFAFGGVNTSLIFKNFDN
ncbi:MULTISPECIES: beta-ketoacyl-ACP synthase [unclassified Campylobacter]|uniref:beta-ketoacyl-ACP synthase n=1 Tax=unclassified Campylobacter TaxID=2593542 RepID=UPI0022E9E977|nr:MULTISPECIES: beta-ketoacyl-ACP synthase [unclassified Campylobacter]MDA3043343.1 beta-ketoacyl-ACP synthase [Campylobacter sp. JMF_09 ED2]MDA3044968.1 beta-ketoacyl-ACP synthase [Campylobacter sp. JMF_07 ED4]MDA3064432.1 beta-ketoacyl-ACP synthase [Campylobacter sp. JMF_11 EL3]MDA3071751.1 beta-ketoacyl-ACP synthase [Campylobacter sp. VBCF_03 NA9]MDA3075316.1 beta-ketoacyl-ACP synthase [Campylobacter sp. JMF_05 ED3]